MRYFPIFLDFEGRRVLVVGGGEQALQKVRLVAKTPAHITVVAKSIVTELDELERAGRIVVRRRAFAAEDVPGVALVYIAEADQEARAQVRSCAEEHNVPVNVVDQPADCDFYTPAIVDRTPVTVAIGTEGAAPVLAREIRAHLEAVLPAQLGRVAEKAQSLRKLVAGRIPDGPARRRFWERLLASDFRHHVLAGDEAAADAVVDRAISDVRAFKSGQIALVGAGPGDPELLTLKAQQALQAADVIVFDRLVAPEVLEYARRDARRINVGKTPGAPGPKQDEISALLVREARQGHRVVRLKGGDPLIFGRAGEELKAAQDAGIDVEIIPGVTSAHACAARIGLPITLRGRHREFSVLTGATADGVLDHDWCTLAEPGAAFAVYMGVSSAPQFRSKLLGAGADPTLSVVIVENGTRADERAFHTSLDDLDACVRDEGLTGPAIIFFGLDWESAGLARPLSVSRYERRLAPKHRQWAPAEIAQSSHWVMG